MEKTLSIWIDDSCQKRIPLDNDINKKKALKIYKHLKEHGDPLNSVNPESVAKNEIGGILEPAKSIGGKGFMDMVIEDVQGLLKEEEDDEADLMQMAPVTVNESDSEDSSTDENCEVNNYKNS
ncbi:hypothetical protein CEXT_248651 [Caerostris extrusa]|uniref:Uncharacterized protein n=1 Tax=Caerostris extrusa TaxID=172846 RepID=A0AAV4U1A1_CAEEX|nr:hypothetical protein CEXT_248651 [Caerostris extrusa]